MEKGGERKTKRKKTHPFARTHPFTYSHRNTQTRCIAAAATSNHGRMDTKDYIEWKQPAAAPGVASPHEVRIETNTS